MNHRLHAVRHTLSEASECYDMMVRAAGAPNIDRLGYTSQIKLDVFREILDRPDLTMEELSSLLRAARNEVLTRLAEYAEDEIESHAILTVDDVGSGPTLRQLPPHQRPEARIPKPVVANAANDPGRDWATLMAHIVIHRANEEGPEPTTRPAQTV